MGHRRLAGRLGAALFLTIPALGVGAVHAGHAAAPKQGGSLIVAYSSDAATFDPAQSVNPPDNGITTGALFSGLYRINTSAHLVPDIASGMPQVSSDQRIFTVHLRHGVVFNGVGFTPREVTAQDVIYTFERVLNPKLKPSTSWGQGSDTVIEGAGAYVAGKAAHVSGLQALDSYTVRFTLARPLSSFLYTMAISANFIVPKEAVARYGADFGSHPVGTGPFMLQQWTKGRSLVLVRNPKYFVAGLPYLDMLTYQFNVGKELELLRWKAGQIDAIGDSSDLAPNVAADLTADPTYAKYVEPTQPSGTSNMLYINNLIPPFDNKLVREAVAYAINKTRLVRLYHQQASVSNQIYPPALPATQRGAQGYPHDIAKAAALLKQAGYQGQPVEVLVDSGSSNDPIEAPSVVQDLKAAGFTVKIRTVSDSQSYQITGTLKGYTLIFSYWGMDYPDAYDFVVPSFTSDGATAGGLNFSRYKNPQVDALVTKAESLPAGKARDGVYGQIDQTLVSDAAVVPLFYRQRFSLDGPHVGSLGWSPAYSPNEWAYAWRQ